ncbi:MAG: hypothetical protein ACRDG9_15420, partial [Actinomycetota bacterium]
MGLLVWLVAVFNYGPTAGLVAGPVAVLAVVLGAGLGAGLAAALIEGATGESSPAGPRETWRNDRRAGLVAGFGFGFGFGFTVGFSVGFIMGLTDGFSDGVAAGLVVGLLFGLVFGLGAGLVLGLLNSQTWPTTLAWLQLQVFGRVPAVRLMPFLEDARERGVLRTVGAVYQFRHATLQDHLAGPTTSDSPESSKVHADPEPRAALLSGPRGEDHAPALFPDLEAGK